MCKIIVDSLKANKTLAELHMERNKIADEGAKAIADAIIYSNLHVLSHPFIRLQLQQLNWNQHHAWALESLSNQ